MLALVRSFLASRAQDNRLTPQELAAFSERTGIDIRLATPKAVSANRDTPSVAGSAE